MFFCGLDLAQVGDFSALSILHYIEPAREEVREEYHTNPYTGNTIKVTEKRPVNRLDMRPTWHLRHVERWRGVAYADVARQVSQRLDRLVEPYTLVIDLTGVGRAAVELIEATGLRPTRVSIHGGDRVSYADGVYRVPKRDLVAAVQVALQNRALRVAYGQDWTPLVVSELQNFRIKIDPATAHDTYSAWRENDHDDIVLSVALAVWASEHANYRVGSVPNPWSHLE